MKELVKQLADSRVFQNANEFWNSWEFACWLTNSFIAQTLLEVNTPPPWGV